MALTDEAIEKIKEMIVSGTLGPGDKLPTEDQLAATLGLSRSSLREAVRALSLMRILDVKRGDGTYVTSLGPEILLDAVSFVIDFHRDESVLHFLEVRRILEPQAVAIVARTATPEQIAQLRALLDQASPSLPTDVYVQLDREFHRTLASFCGNPVLASLIDTLSGPMHRARVWGGVTDPDATRRSSHGHSSIVDAIEAHQPEVAAARALVHVAGLEDSIKRVRTPERSTRRGASVQKLSGSGSFKAGHQVSQSVEQSDESIGSNLRIVTAPR